MIKLDEEAVLLKNVEQILHNRKKHRIIHINCTLDKYYPLCKKNFPKLEYIGYAKTKQGAERAKKKHGGSFFHRSYKTLDQVLWMDTDIMILNTPKDPIELLNVILPLNISHIIIPSIVLCEENETPIFNTALKNGYNYIFKILDSEDNIFSLVLENTLKGVKINLK